MTTREEARKMVSEAEAAIVNIEASIKTNQEALETLLAQRRQTVMNIERLKRGDDLREILIESAQHALKSVDEAVAQQRAGIGQQQAQHDHMDSYVRSLRNAVEG